jgi:hypothetical protein
MKFFYNYSSISFPLCVCTRLATWDTHFTSYQFDTPSSNEISHIFVVFGAAKKYSRKMISFIHSWRRRKWYHQCLSWVAGGVFLFGKCLSNVCHVHAVKWKEERFPSSKWRNFSSRFLFHNILTQIFFVFFCMLSYYIFDCSATQILGTFVREGMMISVDFLSVFVAGFFSQ